jgi:hypothetical protein
LKRRKPSVSHLQQTRRIYFCFGNNISVTETTATAAMTSSDEYLCTMRLINKVKPLEANTTPHSTLQAKTNGENETLLTAPASPSVHCTLETLPQFMSRAASIPGEY